MIVKVESKRKNEIELDQTKECPNCGSRHFSQDYDRGELVCDECGLVIEETYIDKGPEWRSYDMQQEKNRSRTGAPMTELMHDKGLSTDIDSRNKDSYGNSISSKTRSQIYRLRKWQRRTRVATGKEKNLASALRELKRLGSVMSLPKSVIEKAAVLYREASEKDLIRGRSINIILTSLLYIVCRMENIPRMLEDFAENTDYDKKHIGKTYRFLNREMVLKMKPTRPEEYLQRFCNTLKLRGDVKEIAKDILERAEKKNLLSGKGPTGMAAAAIYIASIKADNKRTQKEIAEIANVTEVTIRNRYKELVEELDIDLEV